MNRPSCTFVYTPDYYCDIGAHVFPMEKYERVREALRVDGDIPDSAFLTPEPGTREDVELAHTKRYLDDFLALRRTPAILASELPISAQIVRSYLLAAGGTILACREAVSHGLSMNIGGGFHHAFPDHAEGFCYLNDIAIGIRRVQADGLVERAAVIDCDLHQGNGTAVIFQQDPSVFTFSIHQQNNYPCKRRSDLDLGLADGTRDDEYLGLIEERTPRLLDSFRPELVVYVAGADPYEEDQLGGLRLSLNGLRRRDECVVGHCLDRGVPLAVVLAGGYARNLSDTVRIHHAAARALWTASRGSAGEGRHSDER